MTKKDLIESVASEVDLSKKKSGEALNVILDSIRGSLAEGEKVTLVNFGTFSTKRRKARMGMNPATGEKIRIPATTVAKFKPGKKLKEAVK